MYHVCDVELIMATTDRSCFGYALRRPNDYGAQPSDANCFQHGDVRTSRPLAPLADTTHVENLVSAQRRHKLLKLLVNVAPRRRLTNQQNSSKIGVS
jgi:hypothetical protein